MAWDTEGTKRRIREAATAEFAQYGPDAARVDRIAKLAGVNKERIYNYFGGKEALFTAVLREELVRVAAAVPVVVDAEDDLGDYAGRLFDHHHDHPALLRLLFWEGLTGQGIGAGDPERAEHYRDKVAALQEAQAAGHVQDAVPPAALLYAVLALVGWGTAVPRVVDLLLGTDEDDRPASMRDVVVDAARRLGRG